MFHQHLKVKTKKKKIEEKFITLLADGNLERKYSKITIDRFWISFGTEFKIVFEKPV